MALRVEQAGVAKEAALVAVVGNPNAGKTSLFNCLTGAKQKVANYPGVTVERAAGKVRLADKTVEVIDVPGLYSLEAVSEDERVAVDVLRGEFGGEGRPDLLVVAIDAGNLERNLYFFSQLADAGFPLVVALTKTDVLSQSGSKVDADRLSVLLGVDVIPVVPHKGRGLAELKQAISRNLESPRMPIRELGFPHALESHVNALHERLARAGFDVQRNDVRQALLGAKSEFAEGLRELPELEIALQEAQAELQAQGFLKPSLDVTGRYQWASAIQSAVLRKAAMPLRKSLTDRLDFALTHRVFGLALFVGVMYLVFQSIYTFAQPLMAGIGWAFDRLGDLVGPPLAGVPWLRSLVVDGILAGVGTLLTFLPQICILFLLIAALEGTGYLARAAFMMDRLLGWCGLNGRAFIPLLSSFACAIPGVMSARIMPDKRSRLATILVAPLMSCSARLPVYLLLIGAFIEPQFGAGWAGFALFAMHLLGLLVAIPIAWVLNRTVVRGKRLPFLLELPPYQLPKWRDVWIAVYFRGKVFVQTAGTVIVVMSVMIWALVYFPRSQADEALYRAEFARSEEAQLLHDEELFVQGRLMESSYLGRFGRVIEPAFEPAGFDWRLATAILSAFPARETMVSGLGILFNVGGSADESSRDLRSALQTAKWPDGRPLVTPWTAVGLMVFFALCCQCMSTLAAIRRETNTWKWPVFVFVYMTALAYLGAVFVNQLGIWMG